LGLKDLLELEAGRSVVVEGEEIRLEDLEIRRSPKGANDRLTVHQVVSVEIDPTVTPEQAREGLAREVIRKVQQTRKNGRLNLDDRIELQVACGADWAEALRAYEAMVKSETLAVRFDVVSAPAGSYVETHDIDGESVVIGVRAV
jgi:isoleucyl-tRNA synthetase